MERMKTEPIRTERLVIRPFRESDGAGLFGYLSDPEVVRYEPYDPQTLEECRREAARRAGDPAFYAVCLREGETLIGNLYLGEGECGARELGYVFHAAHQGKGFATEAARALLDHAFRREGVHRVTAMCNPDNTPSWRLLERIGMRREGHLARNVFFRRDSRGEPLWQDTYLYAILAEEWLEEGPQEGKER